MNGHAFEKVIQTNGYAKMNGKIATGENGVKKTPKTEYTYETIQESAKYLAARIPFSPRIGIICGSGLGSLADKLTKRQCFPYEEIPNFPVSTVSGHVGQLVFGYLNDVQVMCMQGRIHYYEGYPLWKCCMPIRVMKLLGVSHIIVSNAAGGITKTLKVGDVMLMKDHVNVMGFAGNNPLHGPNDDRFGPRFPAMNKAYNPELLQVAKDIAKEIGIDDIIKEGVYTCLGGPNYETVAELRLLKMFGIDAVGMSTVHEVITARHCDMTVFAFSLITNICITEYDTDEEANHQEVIDTGKMRQEVLAKLVGKLVEHIDTLVK